MTLSRIKDHITLKKGEFNQKSQYKWTFSISLSSIFDLFRSNLNFSIIFVADLINSSQRVEIRLQIWMKKLIKS